MTSTSEKLFAELSKEAGRPMTREEVVQQKISFVMGMQGEVLDRAAVRKIIEEQDGIPA